MGTSFTITSIGLQRPVVSVVRQGALQTLPRVGDVVTAKVGPRHPQCCLCPAYPSAQAGNASAGLRISDHPQASQLF